MSRAEEPRLETILQPLLFPVSSRRGHHVFRPSVKLDHVLGIDLIAVKDDVNLWVGHVVHAAVVEAGEAGVFGGRSAVHVMPHRVLPHQNSGQEHSFVGRLAGEDGRGQPVLLQGDVVLPRGVAEFTGVFGVPGEIASCSRTITLTPFVKLRQKRKKKDLPLPYTPPWLPVSRQSKLKVHIA